MVEILAMATIIAPITSGVVEAVKKATSINDNLFPILAMVIGAILGDDAYFLDAGHGGNDPGLRGNVLKEKDATLTSAKKVQAQLKGYATVKMSLTTDKTLSLSARISDANNWGAEYFLSIHINAGGGQRL